MKNIIILILVIGNCFTAKSHPLHSATLSPEFAQFRSNLYSASGDGSTTTLIDGTLTQYDTGYSNNIDGNDARKLSNPGENFAMIRGTTTLIVERRRTFQNNDTIFFKMWNMRTIKYKLQLVAYNLNTPGRIGIIKDKYLNTETPISLSDTSYFNFSVTSDPASWATDRFMVVFETPSLFTLPLAFTAFNAFNQKHLVKLNWSTSNEREMKEYKIERSLRENHFIKISNVSAKNASVNNYQFIDSIPAEGINYYRVESISKDGESAYSEVIMVNVGEENRQIEIFPNPVINNNLNLRMDNELPGTYEISLVNGMGQIFFQKKIEYSGGITTENLRILQNIPKGIYHVKIRKPSGEQKLLSVVFQ